MNNMLPYRMIKARAKIIKTINEISTAHDLPSFIMEEIVADILGELRQASKIEFIREMELQNAESIQPNELEE